MLVTWVSWERGVCTAWQCTDMGLRAGGTCTSQCGGREGELTVVLTVLLA